MIPTKAEIPIPTDFLCKACWVVSKSETCSECGKPTESFDPHEDSSVDSTGTYSCVRCGKVGTDTWPGGRQAPGYVYPFWGPYETEYRFAVCFECEEYIHKRIFSLITSLVSSPVRVGDKVRFYKFSPRRYIECSTCGKIGIPDGHTTPNCPKCSGADVEIKRADRPTHT